jgi:hypothetical protein
MATVKVTEDTFPDIVALFILDYIMSDDMVVDNEKWEYFIDKLHGKGLKTELVKYYIATNANEKSRYKEIKRIFRKEGKGRKATINIVNQDDRKKSDVKKDSVIKTIVKKALKAVTEHKKKYNYMPLTESKVDDIIDKVMNECKEEGLL